MTSPRPCPGLGPRPGLGLGLGLGTEIWAEKHLKSNCSLWVCHFFLNNLNKLSFSGTWGWVQVWTSWCCLVCWWCWCYRHWSDHPAGHVQMYPHSGCCHLSDPPRCPAPGCWTAEVPSSAEEGGGPVALCRPSLLARRPLLHPLHLPPHRLCLPLLLLKERMTCLLLLGGGGSSQYYERSWESMKCVGLKESLLPLESVPCPPLDRWGFHSGSKETQASPGENELKRSRAMLQRDKSFCNSFSG